MTLAFVNRPEARALRAWFPGTLFDMTTEYVSTRAIGGLRRTRAAQREGQGLDAAVAELARGQHGVASRGQLIELGLGAEAIEHRLACGRLHRLHRGVYAVGHLSVPKEGWWMAAVLRSGPDALLSHRTAAALWGLRGYSGGAVDVIVPRRSRSSRRIRRHLSRVPTDERAVRAGIPVTSVNRTIFDLAAGEDPDGLSSMLREAEYRELWDRLSLGDLLERYPGKRGSRKVRAALDRLREEPGGPTRSRLEARFVPFLRRHRLSLPRFNDWILLGTKRYRVDCHWPGTGQIVELDGRQGHITRSAFRDDRARERALQVAGYSVTHLTWNQLDDEPEAVAADLRVLLGAGRGTGRSGPMPG